MHADSAYARFWRWFQANGDRLRVALYGKDEALREDASAELREATEQVAPGVNLEIGRGPEGGPHELVVSADGKLDHVDTVKDFVEAAPSLPGWEVVAFRQRMEIGESIEIRIGDQSVSPEDIWFRVSEDDFGLEVTLHVRGLTDANRDMRGLGASLLAEHAVGERDTLTLLNSLHIEPLPKDPAAKGLRPFRELVAVFDQTRVRKYPPPGMLSFDPDDGWQGMQGTINGSDALILFQTGLRPLAGHPDYDQRLIVRVPFHQARPDGMPATEQEYLAVQDLGEKMSGLLQQGQQSLLAMTIMTRGRRDLIFYTSDARGALGRLAPFCAGEQTHRVETDVERDTFWGMYRSFCQAGERDEAQE